MLNHSVLSVITCSCTKWDHTHRVTTTRNPSHFPSPFPGCATVGGTVPSSAVIPQHATAMETLSKLVAKSRHLPPSSQLMCWKPFIASKQHHALVKKDDSQSIDGNFPLTTFIARTTSSCEELLSPNSPPPL